MQSEKIVTACVLVIGNEILSGRTQDANLGYIAKGLNDVGVRLSEARVIPDLPQAIIAALNEVRLRYDYVFTTGGIGPTHDDITAECVARAFGVPLVLDPEAARILESLYRPGELNEARLRMARIPEGAALVQNPISGAPGFRMENVFVLAGVPQIMRAMFDGVAGSLRGGRPMLSRTVTSGLAEGALADALAAIQRRFSEIDIGSYPWYRRGAFGTSLVLRGTDVDRLRLAAAEVVAMVKNLGGTPQEE